MKYILETKGIYKSFGRVEVLKDVDFSLKKGEIKALLGANGAGKSTLIKTVGGVHKQDSGSIFIDGEEVEFNKSVEAINSGISIIYQELSLVPSLTVIQNIFLGRELRNSSGLLNEEEMLIEYNKMCEDFDFNINPNTIVSNLSIAEQQMIEIMKAISRESKIIVMDEPTSSLTSQEKESLFRMIKKLKERDTSIIYITHLLDEVFLLCESASILRNGVLVGDYLVKDLTKQKIAEVMTGKENEIILRKEKSFANYSDYPVLEASNISNGREIKNVSFKVYKGEVIGFAGLVGSGRTEIINLLFGVDKIKNGQIKVNNKDIAIKSSKDAISQRIGLIPEDRKTDGLILNQEIYKNSTAIQLNKFIKNGLLKKNLEVDFTNKVIDELGIVVRDANQKVGELSGGNQQKVVVSKWVGKDLDVLIYDEPTKGIDISAKEDIFKTVDEFCMNDVGVIFISSDLEEVLRVSDRIYIVSDGEIIDEVINEENLVVQDVMNKIFRVEEN